MAFKTRKVQNMHVTNQVGVTPLALNIWSTYFYWIQAIYIQNKQKYLYISNIMQYSNKETPLTDQNIECDQLTFILKKNINNYRVPQVSVNFPIVNRSLTQQQTQENDLDSVPMNSYPVFNHDLKYFTPCFVVDADKFKVQKSSEFYLDYHLKRVQEVDEEKSQIFVPKPSKNHSNCSLCKISYEDYLQHIRSEGHIAKQKKSKIGKNIEALCKLMAKREKRRQKNQKKMQKQIQKKSKQIEKQKKRQTKTKKTKNDISQQIVNLNILV